MVPAGYERFPAIKAGDVMTVRYHDNVVFRKLNPGEKPVDSESGAITKGEANPAVGHCRSAAHHHDENHGD